jgi:hypothetical protein
LFGRAIAINAGSFAYFAVQPLLERHQGSDATRAALYREYVSLLRAAHAGQALDLLGVAHIVKEMTEGQCIEDSVLEIHRLKSGVPFRAFARLGAILGGGSAAQCDAPRGVHGDGGARVTAHAMRSLLATLTAERGLAGHLIAATLGEEDERTTMHAYAASGSAKAGALRRGLVVLNGGVQAPEKKAQ